MNYLHLCYALLDIIILYIIYNRCIAYISFAISATFNLNARRLVLFVHICTVNYPKQLIHDAKVVIAVILTLIVKCIAI